METVAGGRRCALAFAGSAASPAGAAEWPASRYACLCRFSAGGAADALGRLYADALGGAHAGERFIVENRTGGGGLPAAEAVARAEPDGYTLIVTGIPIIVLGPAMNRNVAYDPMRDFTHIAYFGGTPNVLVAHPSLAGGEDLCRVHRARQGAGRRHRICVGGFRHHGQLGRRISGGRGRDQAHARRLQGRRAGAGSTCWPAMSRSAC